MNSMTEVQRALRQAWFEAEQAVSHLIDKKPVLKDDASDAEREAYRDAMFIHREDWNQALGYRDGLHKACVIAKVPNFGEG